MELTKEQLGVMIEQARLVAEAAHKGQTRRDGPPYFEHVEAVANSVEDRLKPIAYLHDVPEDTDITIEDLKDAGFPPYVTDAVDLLTHRNNQPNVKYWGNIAKNRDAAEVKIQDMKHNLRSMPSERQIEKYNKGLKLFSKAGYDIS